MNNMSTIIPSLSAYISYKKNFLKTYFFSFFVPFVLFVLLFFCSLFSSPSFASGKGIVLLGEKFFAEGENISSKDTVEWVLTSSGEIITTSQEKKFSYVFQKLGSYTLRASVEKQDKTKKTTILDLEVVEKFPNFSPLTSVLTSLPSAENGTLFLSGKEGETANVIFSFENSTGTIVEYEFESDLFSDSDENGVIDDDVVNKQDASFLVGGNFTYTYTNTGLPMRARLRVKDAGGNEEESFVNIRFLVDDGEKINRTQNPLQAVVQTLPAESSDGNIWLTGDASQIMIFSGYSDGKILEYRIDTDISFDADNDGNPENDIENKNTDSYQTGETFVFEVQKNENPQIFEVTVVDENGKKSHLRKKILFSKSPLQHISGITLLQPLLFASRSKIEEGDTVNFQVFSAPKDAKFSWDFDGDGIFEIENGEDSRVEYRFSESGNFSVSVHIIEVGEEAVIETKKIQVSENFSGEQETFPPKAIFTPKISGNKVSFSSSESLADSNLLNTDISYAWDFGDGYKTDGPNPEHIYEKTGKYNVSLTVEDSIERISNFIEEIEITEITTEFFADQHGENTSFGQKEVSVSLPDGTITIENPEDLPEEILTENNPPQEFQISFKNFSLPWWIWLFLFLFFTPFLFLLKRKIKEPEKDFGVIFHEMFFGKKSSQEEKIEIGNEEKNQLIDSSETAELVHEESLEKTSKEIPEDSVFSGNVFREENNSVSGFSSEKSENERREAPEWMKNENKSEEKLQSQSIPDLENTDENLEVPDWLKGADSPFSDDLSEEEFLTSPESEKESESLIKDTDEEIPVWLQNSQETSIPQSFEESENKSEKIREEEKNPFSDFDHPDWLNDIKDSIREPKNSEEILEENNKKNSEEEQFLENVQEDELPDWLQSDEEISFKEVNLETEKIKKKRRRKRKKGTSQNIPEETEEGNISLENREENIPEVLFSDEKTRKKKRLKKTKKNLEPKEVSSEEIFKNILPSSQERSIEKKENIFISEKSLDFLQEKDQEEKEETFELGDDSILAQDAKIPYEEDSSEVPQWLQ